MHAKSCSITSYYYVRHINTSRFNQRFWRIPMAEIDLGFSEERPSSWLTNRYFPSKVGGRPAWLELGNLPKKEHLRCGGCQQPKAFLCQIYAPYEDEQNFHRTIYVFLCRSESCQIANSTSNISVLRSQLPLRNDFYSEEPPAEEGEPQPAIPNKQNLCFACGCVGPMACGRCHKANYCSSQHQRAHWPQHKKNCTVEGTSAQELPTIPEILFPEYEIVIESNEQAKAESKSDDDANKEKARLEEFEKLLAAGQTGELKDLPDEELDKFANSSDAVDDKYFRKFKKEVAKEPEQIIRYKRNGEPLWIADVEKTLKNAQLQVPKCEACGGPRQFEFQIMPQMLLLLKDERLDWGVMAVYTCAESCKPPVGVGYQEEFIIKQDILPDVKQ